MEIRKSLGFPDGGYFIPLGSMKNTYLLIILLLQLLYPELYVELLKCQNIYDQKGQNIKVLEELFQYLEFVTFALLLQCRFLKMFLYSLRSKAGSTYKWH